MPKLALIVDYGAVLKVKDGRFKLLVRENKQYVTKWDHSPPEVEGIVVAVKGVSISAAAIELAAKNGIDVFSFLAQNHLLTFHQRATPRFRKRGLRKYARRQTQKKGLSTLSFLQKESSQTKERF
jgi:CRISPR associated protein Cas1.